MWSRREQSSDACIASNSVGPLGYATPPPVQASIKDAKQPFLYTKLYLPSRLCESCLVQTTMQVLTVMAGAPGTVLHINPNIKCCGVTVLTLKQLLSLQIEKLQDAVLPVSEIVKRCPAKQLMGVYKVPAFESTDQFLHHIALARGKLKKGGTVDFQAAAKVVLQDWNDGRIPFYTMPPQREAQEGHAAAEVVTHFGTDFNAEQVCALA